MYLCIYILIRASTHVMCDLGKIVKIKAIWKTLVKIVNIYLYNNIYQISIIDIITLMEVNNLFKIP